MPTRHRTIHIPVGGRTIAGTLVAPSTIVPGVMLVHGWDGSQEQYIARAHEIAALGCICLTFDLRGHASDRAQRDTVTREDNLADMLAAYDLLVGHPAVDESAVVVAGSSYGGYLAAVLSSLRPVRWLALRAPALYKDEDWMVPKNQLNRAEVAAYRATMISAEHNRALAASSAFRGDVLLVESQHDALVPHPVIENYLAAFKQANSMTYRVIKDADHSLSQKAWSQSYTSLLVNWVDEMVQGAKQEAETRRAQKNVQKDSQKLAA
jgi:pimeloyl-ACP methyl ester carboxylesterase